jgi:predicted Zn-dependent protease
VLARKGRIDPALTSFRTALDRDATHLAARYELAMTLWTASRREEALAEMTAVVTADPAHGAAHERLAVWNYYAGNREAARLHLAEAERLGQPVPAQLAGLLDRADTSAP